MRAILLCLGLAACQASPKVEYIYIERAPVVDAHPAPPPQANVKTAEVVLKEQHLVAEAGRYAVWKQSKPPIITKLGTLTATASAAVRQLQEAKTLRDRAAALPAAEAAVNELSTYLATKGD